MISYSKLGQPGEGQLGNQMFHYAFLRSTAHRLGVQFYCPRWSGDDFFILNDSRERAQKCESINKFYQEPSSRKGFLEECLLIKDGTEVHGCFQSEKYFEKDLVRKWFTFKDEVRKKVEEEYKNVDLSKSASLSLRIDDEYNKLRKCYPLYSLSYYQKALEQVRHKDRILIFSDCIDRAKVFFKDLNAPNVHYIEDLHFIEQLYLMTLCRGNVIVNSTFAWWGAWLNAHQDKTVVVPKEWFRIGWKAKITDIAPAEWIQIKTQNPIFDHYLTWYIQYRINRKLKTLKRSLAHT